MIIVLISIFITFLIWSSLMLKGKLNKIDDRVYNKIKITKIKTLIWRGITFFGSAKAIILFCIIFLLVLKDKKIATIIIICMLIEWGSTSLLKHTFKRPRPNINRLVEEKGYSYPSGHTMTSTIFYGFIIFLIIISNIILPLKIITIFLLILLILLIGYSRIYLGVHYFSDVIGAILFGNAYLLLYIFFTYFILKII